MRASRSTGVCANANDWSFCFFPPWKKLFWDPWLTTLSYDFFEFDSSDLDPWLSSPLLSIGYQHLYSGCFGLLHLEHLWLYLHDLEKQPMFGWNICRQGQSVTFCRLPDHPFDVKVVCNRSITTIDYQSEGLTNQCIFLPKFIPGGHFVPWALRGRSSPIVLTLYVLQRSKSSAFQLNSAFLTGFGIKFLNFWNFILNIFHTFEVFWQLLLLC